MNPARIGAGSLGPWYLGSRRRFFFALTMAIASLLGVFIFLLHIEINRFRAAQLLIFFAALMALVFFYVLFMVGRHYHLLRAKAEKVLYHLASIVEGSDDSIIGQTLDGVVTSWNRGAERMYGYSANEMVGRSIRHIVPEDRREELSGWYVKLSRGKPIRQFESEHLRKGKKRFYVSLTVSPIFDVTGKVAGASMIVRDINDQKALEKRQDEQARALERSHTQLARREKIMRSMLEDLSFSKKTLEVQKKSLQEANQRLETLSKLKDEFVATASHELRTPLTAIREGISLLHDRVLGPINDEQAEFLAAVDENIDRLTELINNILDLAKIESGRLLVMRRRIGIADLIRSMIESRGQLNSKRNLRLFLPPVPDVLADPNRITQVLWNIFNNAVKFTHDDGNIAISLEEKAGVVSVSIEDDGIGIAKDDQPKLFKKFSQVGGKFSGGTGLGLALCKEIIALHKGTLGVVSETGAGSKFTFELPVYSGALALSEFFAEQVDLARKNLYSRVAFIVLETTPSQRDDLLDFVRRHVYGSDSVFDMAPGRIVVLAATSDNGLPIILERLTSALQEKTFSYSYGSALWPRDGSEPQELLSRAVDSMRPGEELHEKDQNITR